MRQSKKSFSRIVLFFLFIVFSLSGIYAAPSQLKIHFLNVGEGDCLLVQTPNGCNMLIDAGTNEDINFITNYLTAQKIKRLDVVIATHPHDDHVISIPDVIRHFNPKDIYMPKITEDFLFFQQLMMVIKEKSLKLKVNTAHAGMSIKLDPALKIELLAPNGNHYDNLENYSIVVKITFKNNSFLLTGDAVKASEMEMLAKKYNLKADVLKVGHHGSNFGSTTRFLKAVAPRYAIISVGAFNQYGYPSLDTLKRLKAIGAKIYRTDLHGTIIASSNGNRITIKTEL